MKNRGQALVEFVIVLPILMLLILGAIDFGTILYKKYMLENDLDYVVELARQNKTSEINTYSSKNGFVSKIENSNDYTTIIISKSVEVMTPGLNQILGNPYTIEAKRVIINE